jgi:hypothetical protein
MAMLRRWALLLLLPEEILKELELLAKMREKTKVMKAVWGSRYQSMR